MMSFITLAYLRRDTKEARECASKLALSRDGGHHLIWSLFDTDPKAKRDFIYRSNEKGGFTVVSARQPQGNPAIWDYKTKPYAPVLQPGQRFGFMLCINPTMALSQTDRARSKTVDVLMHAKKQKGAPLTPEEREEKALAWLAPKLERCGAALETDLSYVKHYKQLHIPRKKDDKIMLSSLDVEGVLTATNPEKLQESLLTGIGSGKAFGLGLLLLRPLPA